MDIITIEIPETWFWILAVLFTVNIVLGLYSIILRSEQLVLQRLIAKNTEPDPL